MRLALLTACLCSAQAPLADDVVDAVISRTATAGEARRVGINLGVWTSWGAEQLAANVLMNPGFEGVIDRAIVRVAETEGAGFSDDTGWLAREPGFWDGAGFHVLTGAAAGREGRIGRSEIRGGRAHFTAREAVAGLAAGDILALTKTDDGQAPTQWWLEGPGDGSGRAAGRPGSAGTRSLRLGAGAGASSYLDAIGDRAGKLLPLRGEWTLSVWARGAGPGGRLRVQVIRNGTPAFLNVTVELDTEWREYRWTMRPADEGSAGTLAVRFANEGHEGGGEGDVWIDDSALQAAGGQATGFREEVVATLRTLRPGYLRDWQGQLGDTFANRVAPAGGRRATRYRPGGREATDFAYGLPEFLALARETGANPWVVLPATFTLDEWAAAGAFLRAQADAHGFSEVVVEFGNENWNELFRPAGIPQVEALTEASGRAFARLLAGAGQDRRIRPVLSGAFHNLSQHETLLERTDGGTMLAFAPYWAYDPEAPRAFFPEDHSRRLRALSNRHETAIYEMNAHSLSGAAPAERVNEILAGPATAAAMVWNTIGAWEAGVERICIYTLAGFDTLGEGKGRLIRLFGVTRDLAEANRFRPEGEALALLNRAAGDSYHAVETGSGEVRAAAFAGAEGWRVVVVSRSAGPRRVRLVFPNPGPRLPVFANGRRTGIRQRGRSVEIDVPAFGIVLADSKGNPNER